MKKNFTDGHSWAESIRDWTLEIPDDLSVILKDVAQIMFSEIIDKTPVWFKFEPDAGNTKWNWTASIGAPQIGILKGADTTGTRTKRRMESVLEKYDAADGKALYLSNSLPHIHILEDGGYPQTVIRGSYNSRTKKYEVRSIMGYSKQAPAGMVKIVESSFALVVDQIARERGFR